MLAKVLLAHTLFAVGIAVPVANYIRCDNTYSSADLQAIEAQFTQDLAAAAASGTLQRGEGTNAIEPTPIIFRPFCRTVKVVWHVIYESQTVQGGYMTDQAVKDSIKAMNTHYSGSTFKFALDHITRTENQDWFNNVDRTTRLQDAMKQQLRVGDAMTLNVYTVNFLSSNILGYAPLPQDYAAYPWNDGVVIKHSTVPGGAAPKFDQGKTLTHEVGHWLGLLHVFNEQGACVEQDMVDDTPVQATMSFGCPSSKDSCPNFPGEDSFHNYMDYADDACMTAFSPGQIARMKLQSDLYRKIPSKVCYTLPTIAPTIVQPPISLPHFTFITPRPTIFIPGSVAGLDPTLS